MERNKTGNENDRGGMTLTYRWGKGRQEEGLRIISIGIEGNKMIKDTDRGGMALTYQWGKGWQEDGLRIILIGIEGQEMSYYSREK